MTALIRSSSAIGVTPYLWLATWFLQVMPIFFFVGGFANLRTYDASAPGASPRGRSCEAVCEGLLVPTAVFLGVWAVVLVVLHVADVGAQAGPPLWGDARLLRGVLPPGATIPFGPLWFLAVYLLVVAIAPLHDPAPPAVRALGARGHGGRSDRL